MERRKHGLLKGTPDLAYKGSGGGGLRGDRFLFLLPKAVWISKPYTT